jgi:predicted TIM-barrel fold metal-dependent hydrolase
MIVDCHTHIWQSPDQLGRIDWGDVPRAARQRNQRPNSPRPAWHAPPAADPDHHMAQASSVDKIIVLGFKSKYLGAEIPNRYVADYVNRFPQKLIGFAGIDPTQPGAVDELREAQSDLRLRGLTLAPANQDFHPADSRAMDIYAEAEKLKMPVLIHAGNQFTQQGKMEYARPYLFDEIARTFPNLRLILAQMAHPWIDECIALLGKHPHVYADVSGLLARSWQAYTALVSAHQNDVMDKLLFGSDFPYRNAAECIEAMYSINQMTQGTNLPIVPRETLRGIVERDTPTILGLA